VTLLTTSSVAERPADLLGDQHPRILAVPEQVSTAGVEAAELAASAGLVLDPWQRFVLEQALGERADGKWAAFEVGLVVGRQNGKGSVLEALELAGLYLFGERLILHSAHEFKTAQEGFSRVLHLIEGSDSLRRRVKRVRTSHGEEGIELTSGQRLRFVARSTGSGRGFSADRILLDEAFNLPETAIEALLPTLSARPNPQVWYTSSAPDKDLAPCDALARVRRRGLQGQAEGLAYFEWSITPHDEFCRPGCAAHDDPSSVRSWARANPGLGIRISVEHVAREYASMGAVGFARERLGVGNYPLEADAWQVISADAWDALLDRDSQAGPVVAFSADITPDRSWGAISVAGRRDDGQVHVEVVEHKPRTSWMVERLVELVGRWKTCALVIDGSGQAGSLIAPLEEAGLEVVKPSARDMGQACGQFYEAAVDSRTLRHLGQPEMATALAGAQRRPLGDAWAWSRKDSSVDIAPLVASTLATWGFTTRAHLMGPFLPAIY
jgi:phage terminase large subunit-like protein